MCNCVLPFPLPSFSPPCVHTLSSSSEVGRLVWSLVRHCSVKLANFGVLGGDNQYWSTSSTNRCDRTDHFLGTLRRGGGFRGIRNRALIGCMLHRAKRRRRRRRENKEVYLLKLLSDFKLTRFSLSNLYSSNAQGPLVTL